MKHIRFAILLLVSGLATVAAAAEHAEHGGGPPAPINWWEWKSHAPPVGWFLIDFAIFFGALVYFAARPLGQALAQRHLTIKRAIADAAAAHGKASAKHREYQDKLARIEEEARELVEGSRKDGALERERMIKTAEEYTARMKQDSSTMADQELMRARGRLRAETARAALAQAEALLKKELTQADQQRLLEAAIQDLESGKALDSSRNRAKAGLSLVTGGAA